MRSMCSTCMYECVYPHFVVDTMLSARQLIMFMVTISAAEHASVVSRFPHTTETNPRVLSIACMEQVCMEGLITSELAREKLSQSSNILEV